MLHALPPTPVPGHPVTIDKIVAIVNNGVITDAELNRRVALLRARLASEHVPQPPRGLLRRRVLSQMVVERLELQYAQRLGIHVTNAQVDRAQVSLAARNHMSLDQFRQALAGQGLTIAQFRHRLRTELIIRELVQRRISRSVVVSNASVRRFVAAAQAGSGSRYRLSEITLTIPAAASPLQREAVIARARRLLAKIKNGERFSEAAIDASEDQYALAGGNLGWRPASRLRPLFVRAVGQLPVGSVVLVHSQNTVYILKLDGRKVGQRAVAIPQVRLREIVLNPSGVASLVTVHEKLKDLKARIARGQKFSAVARAYSEAASAMRGGRTGWISIRALPPTLVGPAESLPLHTVSGPYADGRGQALIEVVARRVHAGMTRAEARRLLRMRKGSALYVRWLQTLRDDAYVRYPGRG
ncbi:MAG: peptidylprolyl isomerase [Acidiferrobacter sp.]